MVRQIFEGATYSVIGDGKSTYFWTDKWLPNGRLRDITPNMFAVVPKRALRLQRVHDGLLGGWLDHISPDLEAPAIWELFQWQTVWQMLPSRRVWRTAFDGDGTTTIPIRHDLVIVRCLAPG
jgi:hypothetical protein